MVTRVTAAENNFPVVLFIIMYNVGAGKRERPWEAGYILYKVDLTFQSVHKILKCVHSNESC